VADQPTTPPPAALPRIRQGQPWLLAWFAHATSARLAGVIAEGTVLSGQKLVASMYVRAAANGQRPLEREAPLWAQLVGEVGPWETDLPTVYVTQPWVFVVFAQVHNIIAALAYPSDMLAPQLALVAEIFALRGKHEMEAEFAKPGDRGAGLWVPGAVTGH